MDLSSISPHGCSFSFFFFSPCSFSLLTYLNVTHQLRVLTVNVCWGHGHTEAGEEGGREVLCCLEVVAGWISSLSKVRVIPDTDMRET